MAASRTGIVGVPSDVDVTCVLSFTSAFPTQRRWVMIKTNFQPKIGLKQPNALTQRSQPSIWVEITTQRFLECIQSVQRETQNIRYGASSRVHMSLTLSQKLPFEAYKRLIEGFRTPMSVRDCKAPISSDTPEAITHDGSIVPGSSATPSPPPGIAYTSCRGSARRCLQQFRQVWEPRLVRGDEYH